MQLQPELDPEEQYMENNYTWPFRTGRNSDKPKKPYRLYYHCSWIPHPKEARNHKTR